MDNRQRQIFSDAVLRAAVIENHAREMASIPSNEELSSMYTFSARHEARMKRLFSKAERKEKYKKIFAVSKKVAAVFIIITMLLFGVMLTSPQVRAAVERTIVEWYEKFTRFTFSADTPIEGNVEWRPSYVPEGFVEIDGFEFVDRVMITWQHANDNMIIFDYNTGARSIGVDNEHSEYAVKLIDGVEYHVFSANTEGYRSVVIWEHDGYAFSLESEIKADELLEIAFSVASKK